MGNTQPVFVVSDLHMGDGGPRDNFAHASGGRREQEFWQFLDYVEDRQGKLYIIGDLFELWQSNLSKVLTCRVSLLDRLAQMHAKYILGNHDIDLRYFIAQPIQLTHPLFRGMTEHQPVLDVNGTRILLIHGHEQDEFCRSDVPGIGRVSAIYAGLKEDRNGGPICGKYGEQTVEARSLGKIGRLSRIVRRCFGKPSRRQIMRRAILDTWRESACHALIYGHTHEPGQFYRYSKLCKQIMPLPIYNCGTWAEQVNSFVRIDADGRIQMRDWVDGKSVRNNSRLVVG